MNSHARLPTAIISFITVIAMLAFYSLLWSPPAKGAEPAETLVRQAEMLADAF